MNGLLLESRISGIPPVQLPFQAICNIDGNFESENPSRQDEINSIRREDKTNHDILFVLKPMYDEVVTEMKGRNDMYRKFSDAADEFIEKSQSFREIHFLGDLERMFIGNRFVHFFQEHERDMRNLLMELSSSKEAHLKERMVELMLFHYGLKVLRIPWHPGLGRGCQETEYFLHRKIAKLTIQKEKEVKDKWLEENMLGKDETEDDITKTYLWYI